MYRFLSPKFFLIFFSGFLAIFYNVWASDVTIKSQSEQELVLEFAPQDWEINYRVIHGETYYKIHFENCDYRTAAGQPMTPERIVTVGIPFESQVYCEILEVEAHKKIKGKLQPNPSFGRDVMSELSYWENPNIYQDNHIFPLQVVQLAQPAIFRNQQVVSVHFFPVQFSSSDEQIMLYNRIVVRINFSGGQQNRIYGENIKDLSLNRHFLINPIQAAKWKKKRKDGIRKNNLRKAMLSECYKIYIRDSGIYKITGEELKNAGVNLSQIQPDHIKIYNNGGFQLPHPIYESRSDSLIENAIFVSEGGDNAFDAEDYILFFGKSVNGWKYDRNRRYFSHYLNPYTRENVYWLCWHDPSPGKRMANREVVPDESVSEVTHFYDQIYLENEYKNLLNSGTIWLGDYFSSIMPQRTYQFDLAGVVENGNGLVKINLAAVTQGEHGFSLYLNDNFLGELPTFYSGAAGNNLAIKLKQFSKLISGGFKAGYNRFMIKYLTKSNLDLAYLDWIELSFHRQLMARDDELMFYSPDSIGFYKYHLYSFSSDDIYVFDVTRFQDVIFLETSQIETGSVQVFDSTSSAAPKTYLAVTADRFKSPMRIEKDIPSNLRDTQMSADFIIIVYDDFVDAAFALKSLREDCDTLKTQVVKISDIFDEFSWGLVDPTAIRDFIKYAYENWKRQPLHVLLLGDGDYDYKNIISPHDPNWIPPFETSDLSEGSSRVRDDWYACVEGNDNLLDLAIGRIPARNPDEAWDVVKKIVAYENSPQYGEWSTTVTMVADDEYGQGGGFDGIDHIPDADRIAENLVPINYNVKKIYLTEYPVVHEATISGIRKPAAHENLIRQINQGNLIINFIGHGNEELWTHEHVLVQSDDLPRLNNGAKQAFWIAATCNFARFDKPNFQSFAERLVTVPNHGAIAVFSSSRAAYASANVSLNRALYNFIFNGSNTKVRLGDVAMYAKNSLGNTLNDQLYNLIGDPTMRLAMPSCSVQFSNHSPDSMKALSRTEVEGDIQSIVNSVPDYHGQLLFKAFDSRIQRSYAVNEWTTWNYILPGNTIFRGYTTITDGNFKTQFIVPKDITYGGKEGRFMAFFWQNNFFGSGCLDSISIGGTKSDFDDQEGPKIKVGFEGQDFMSGSFIPPSPVLEITIADSLSGVNIAGDIGHKITMVFDGNQNDKIELNDFFNYKLDSYVEGIISYPLTNLDAGTHYIQVKAWDNCNNSGQAEAEFTIASMDNLIIRDVLNYPNPFSNSTEFTFWTNRDCDVQFKIYTLSGRLVCQFNHLKAETGFNHFHWNGLDQDGDPLANGVYLYKICASCYNGNQKIRSEKIEKCVIVR